MKLARTLTLAAAGAALVAAAAVSPALAGSRPLRATHRLAPRADGPLERLAALADKLGLDDTQKAEIRAVLHDRRDALVSLGHAELAARAALNQAIHQPDVEPAAVTAASAAVAHVDADLAVERAGIYADIAAILTDAQRAQLAVASEAVSAAVRARVLERIGDPDRPGVLLGRVGDRIGLSDAQRSQISGVLAAHRDTFVTLANDEAEARRALRISIRQPAVDEAAVRTASAAVAPLDRELALERAATFSEVAAVLTPDQLAQLQELREAIATAIRTRIEAMVTLAGVLL